MADPTNLPPLPADHLDHPDQWATGEEPATDKQKGFVKVLERQHPDLVPDQGLKVDSMGKSEASEIIDHLKSGKKVAETSREEGPNGVAKDGTDEKVSQSTGTREDEKIVEDLEKQVRDIEKEEKVGEKRKDAPSTTQMGTKETTDGDADDEESEVDSAGKDVKKTKQTTLDAAMASGSQVADDEGDDEGRKVKKARTSNEVRVCTSF